MIEGAWNDYNYPRNIDDGSWARSLGPLDRGSGCVKRMGWARGEKPRTLPLLTKNYESRTFSERTFPMLELKIEHARRQLRDARTLKEKKYWAKWVQHYWAQILDA